ncbi:MAG TPA: cytochrome c biogenesis protein [Methanosarcinaceae archaeon]|nr:cytochrome c biogenesis protein [Methanosarcinaceae archaeon]
MKKLPVLQQTAINRCRSVYLTALLIVLLIATPTAASQPDITIEYFYEDGCLKCQKALPAINEVIVQYENINYSTYEVMTSYNRMKTYGVYSVPAVVINQNTVITYTDYKSNITLLKEILIKAIENAPPITGQNTTQPVGRSAKNVSLPEMSLPFVLIIGLLAGFNPCLIAVMAFLASVTLSSMGGRKDMLMIVAGFCAGIFATYMIVGLGVLHAINLLPGTRNIFTSFMVMLIGVLGLWHIYDAYHLKIHDRSIFKTPQFVVTFMSRIEGKNILLLSFVAGGFFSLVKAPCVGAVYLAILDMLITKTDVVHGAVYLCAYNLGVVLPVLVLGGLLAVGLSPETITEFREKRRIEVRFVTGIVLIVLALLLYFNII